MPDAYEITVRKDRTGLPYHLLKNGRWKNLSFDRQMTLAELEQEFGPTTPIEVDNVEALLTDHLRLLAEAADLRALVATCVCPSWPPEGPSEECPVHGAVRAFNDASAEIAAMRPVVGAAIALVQTWKLVRSVLVDGSTPAALRDAVNVFTDHGTTSGWARTTPEALGVGNDVPEPTPAPQKAAEPPVLEEPFVAVTRNEYASLRRGAGALVAELLDVSANLEEHIQTRADEIAAPRVAQAESVAVGKIAEVIAQAEHDKQRSDDLLAELRRVLAAQCKNVDLYWPQVQRVKALADAWRKAGMDGEAKDIYEALNPKEAEVTT